MDMKDKIDHVVLLMLENRSLDNVLGWLYRKGERPTIIGADTRPDFQGLQLETHFNEFKGRKIYATRGTVGATGHSGVGPQPLRVPGFDPHEEYEHVTQQLFGTPDHPTQKNPPYGTPAKMKGFADDYDASYEQWEQLNQSMEAYSPEQLPILNGLARAYAVSDAWRSSVPTQTNPNRAFSLCGTSLGRVNNTTTAVEKFETPTLWNALPRSTTWGVYYHDIWYDSKCYTQYTFPHVDKAEAPGEFAPISKFYSKATGGALPTFSYLEPKWGYGKGYLDGGGFYCGKILGRIYGSQGNDYHPPTWVGPGEAFVDTVYRALSFNRSRWARTLLIITFDEHGGTYDHVDPEWGATRPDGHFGPDGFGFDRWGVRVPTLLISPWIHAQTVFRSPIPGPQAYYDHTSLIATILKWCNVDPARANLGDRVAKAPTFDNVLADRPRSDVPMFHLPPGYADQGKSCWIESASEEQLPAGVGRLLVAKSKTLEELEARVDAWIERGEL